MKIYNMRCIANPGVALCTFSSVAWNRTPRTVTYFSQQASYTIHMSVYAFCYITVEVHQHTLRQVAVLKMQLFRISTLFACMKLQMALSNTVVL